MTLPMPAIHDERSAPYFDALASGTLMLRSCRRCGHVGRPSASISTSCHRDDLTWIELSGDGKVVVSIVDHTDVEAPVLALVELTEGPWIMTRIVRVGPSGDVPRSIAVRLEVVQTAHGEPIPAFAPCSAGGVAQ